MNRLEEALKVEADRLEKDGTIKRFEFTFELAWKLMQAIIQSQGLEANSPKSSIRVAAKIGLIDNPDEVYEYAKKFAPDARSLLKAAQAEVSQL